jgi:hypothetical protein
MAKRSVLRLRARSGRAMPMLEALEDRRLLASVAWDGGPDGTGIDWYEPTNWSTDEVPLPGDEVTIGAGYTVAIDADVSFSAGGSLTLESGVQLAGLGNLTVEAGADLAATDASLLLPLVVFEAEAAGSIDGGALDSAVVRSPNVSITGVAVGGNITLEDYVDPTISGNTFASVDPLGIYAGHSQAMLTENSFVSGDRARVTIWGGTVESDTIWQPYGSVGEYYLRSTIIIAPEASLTVQEVELTSWEWSSYSFWIDGLVQATDVALTNRIGLWARAGGELRATGLSALTTDPSVSFSAGSSGYLTDSVVARVWIGDSAITMTNVDVAERLTLEEGVSATITGNTFTGVEPLVLYTNQFDAIVAHNEFTGSEPATVTIQGGDVETDTTWQPFGSIQRFALESAINVASGVQFTVADVEMFGDEVWVLGTLDMSDAVLGATVKAHYGGAMYFSGVLGTEDSHIDFSAESSGSVTESEIHSIEIHESAVTVTDTTITNHLYLDHSISPTITDNTFVGDRPLSVMAQQSMAVINSNTFDSPTGSTIVILGGDVQGDIYWGRHGSIIGYQLNNGFRVRPGADLVVEDVVFWLPYSDAIIIDGDMHFRDVTIDGRPTLWAHAGSTLDLVRCVDVSGRSNIIYDYGSSGEVTDSDITVLEVYADDVSLTGSTIAFSLTIAGDIAPLVVGNTFESTTPLTIWAQQSQDILTQNSFTSPEPASVRIDRGTIRTDTVWTQYGSIESYELDNQVTVLGDAQLTVADVMVGDLYLAVEGALHLQGALLTEHPIASIHGGGEAHIIDSTFAGYGSLLHFHGSSVGTIVNSTLLDLSVGTPAIVVSDTVIEGTLQIDESIHPSITNCSFTGTAPLDIYTEHYLSLVASNTFDSVQPATVEMRGGAIEENTIWQAQGSLSEFLVRGDFYVEANAELSIQAISMTTWWSTDTRFYVDGVLGMIDVEVTTEASFTARGGGLMDLTNVTLSAGDSEVTYLNNSSGAIVGGEIGRLLLESPDVSVAQVRIVDWLEVNSADAPDVIDNDFLGPTPLTTTAEHAAVLLAQNTFSNVDPVTVRISGGDLRSDAVWNTFDNVAVYQLTADVTVKPGATLRVEQAELSILGGGARNIRVEGALQVVDVEVTEHVNFLALAGGRMHLYDVQLAGSDSLVRYEFNNAGGEIRHCSIHSLVIDAWTPLLVRSNDFSQGTVTLEGESSQEVDLRWSWWGSTDPAAIESRIMHQADNPSLPLAIFEPFLETPPMDDDVAPEVVEVTINDGDAGRSWIESIEVTLSEAIFPPELTDLRLVGQFTGDVDLVAVGAVLSYDDLTSTLTVSIGDRFALADDNYTLSGWSSALTDYAGNPLGGSWDREVELASLHKLAGDIDGDRLVGQIDLGLLLATYELDAGDPLFNDQADLNGNGAVDQPDLGILLANYEASLPESARGDGGSGGQTIWGAPLHERPRALDRPSSRPTSIDSLLRDLSRRVEAQVQTSLTLRP